MTEAQFMPTPQAPIGSGFGAASTPEEVIAGFDWGALSDVDAY